jgi:hypothetical protein
MGLRIIGRKKFPAPEVTDADRNRELEHTMSEWLAARGGAYPQSAKVEFMAHFRRVHSRMTCPTEPSMLEMAHQLKATIANGDCGSIASHSKVDVATLLELL